MNDTSLSLLARLRQSPDPDTWARLVGLYAPLLRAWLRKYNVQESDIDDLIQEVLLTVSKEMRKFDHAGHPGAFRGWLKQILLNRLRNFWRARDRRKQAGDANIDGRLRQLEDPASALSRIWNRQHDQFVARQLLSMVESDFAATTWKAFVRVALEGARADDVARELNLSVNAVFIAKSRVLSRLRREAQGLVEASSDFLADR